jgi:hypothetical protein
MRDIKNFIKDELTNKAPDGCDLRIGDLVEWVNGNGVVWQNKIIGFNYSNEYNKRFQTFVHLDTDSFWFPHDHRKLKKKINN